MRIGSRGTIVALVTGLLPCLPAAAQARGWSLVTARAGSPVARLETGDPVVPVIELACQGRSPAIGVQASAPAALRLLPIVFTGGSGAPISMGLPRIGGVTNFAALLPDTRLLDGLTGSWSSWRIAAGGRPINPPLDGARAIIRQALAGCYAGGAGGSGRPAAPVAGGAGASAAKPVGGQGRAIFLDAALPPALRRDLADFEMGCSYGYDDSGTVKRLQLGPALAAPAAIQRADFNGDGIDDYVVDIAKLRCARSPAIAGAGTGGLLMLYTSTADKGFIHSFDASYTNYRIVAGRKASLVLHQDFVADEVEGDGSPLVDETVSMTGPTQWNRSQLGRPDWRLGQLDRYPAVVRDQFARWDGECAAVGRRLTINDDNYGETITETYYAGDGTTDVHKPFDLNGDGKRDYVIDTTGLACSAFGEPREPRPPYYCGANCTLIAVLSRPDGSHALDRVAGSISLRGNGDPASIGPSGGQIVIRWPGGFAANRCVMTEISWKGVTPQRRTRSCDP